MPPPRIKIQQPTLATLRKYGLSPKEWLVILRSQGGVCAICRRVPPSGRLVVDHQHVKGWKKMKPEDRKRYVRGLACFLCNGKCLSRHVNVERARAVVEYLTAYLKRLASNS